MSDGPTSRTVEESALNSKTLFPAALLLRRISKSYIIICTSFLSADVRSLVSLYFHCRIFHVDILPFPLIISGIPLSLSRKEIIVEGNNGQIIDPQVEHFYYLMHIHTCIIHPSPSAIFTFSSFLSFMKIRLGRERLICVSYKMYSLAYKLFERLPLGRTLHSILNFKNLKENQSTGTGRI